MNEVGSIRLLVSTRRLAAHGLILGIILWSVYFWVLSTAGLRDRNGNLKGTDFLHFYTLARIAREHRGDFLYAMNAQAGLAVQHVPEAAGIHYLPLYPPQVSVLLLPLSSFSYSRALVLWWIGTGLAYGICCYTIWRACPNLQEHRLTFFLGAAAFPPFFHVIAWGQTSAIALVCFTGMFYFLGRKRDLLSGIGLGCLIFKPQLALAAAIIFLAIGSWKLVAGAIVSAAAQLAIGILYYGVGPFRQWVAMLRSIPSLSPWLEPRPYQTHCLRTFWSMLIPSPTLAFLLYVASAFLVLGMTISVWKYKMSLPVRFSALLFATVLVAPHLTVYDLLILAPAFLLLADWLIGEPPTSSTRRLATALYLVYMLPLVGPLARWIHVQLSVIAMGSVLFLIWRLAARRSLFSASESNANDSIEIGATTRT